MHNNMEFMLIQLFNSIHKHKHSIHHDQQHNSTINNSQLHKYNNSQFSLNNSFIHPFTVVIGSYQ